MTFIVNPYRFGAAPAWTPAEFPSLTGWWSMKRSPGLPGTDATLSSWEEVSGSDTFVQVFTDPMPTQRDRAGLPAAEFEVSAGERLGIPADLATMCGNTGLMAIVFNLTGNPAPTDISTYWDGAIVVQDASGYFAITASTQSGTPRIWGAVYQSGTKQLFNSVTTGAIHIAMLWLDDTNLNFSIDGVEETPIASGPPSSQVALMRIGGSAGVPFFNGDIHEVVMAKSGGSSGERASLLAYLQGEVGL